MRVLVPTIRDLGQVGGTSTHLEMLSRGLEQAGHEVRVLYLGAGIPACVNRLGIVWPAGALNRLRRGWGMVYAATLRGRLLAGLVEEELRRAEAEGRPYEVVNAQEVYSVPGIREAADRHGVPLVLTLHGYPLFESVSEGYSDASALGLAFLRRVEMQALRFADAVVTVDSRLHDHVLRLVPERAGRARSLFNSIDTSAFSPGDETRGGLGPEEVRRTWDVPIDRVVLFCPRRLVKKNGVIYPALALAAMSPAERSRFVLLHAGDGGERAAIERVVADAGLEGSVRMLGNQDRQSIQELYGLSDIVLVPSVHSENVEEATSLAALEAMASGRPLIAGAVGGLAEIVDDGVTGLLVPGGQVEALRDAMLRLADDGALGERLAAAAREYVVSNHSHVAAARAYAGVYEEARDVMRAGVSGHLPGVSRTAAPQPQTAVAQTVDESTPPPSGDRSPSGAAVPRTDRPAAASAAPEERRPPAVSVLGFPLDPVTMEQAREWVVERFDGFLPAEETALAVSFNPEIVVRAWHEPASAEALIDADLRYPDGVGAVWAARRVGARPVSRIPGIELAEAVLAEAADRGVGVFFLGAAPGVAEQAALAWQDTLPGLFVAGVRDGYFDRSEETEIVREVSDSGAGLLLAALGAPKQEIFLHRHRRELGAAVALGVGGSFDVWAGVSKRAPHFAQRLGVEWLWRLASDPRRARRQAALPRFALRVLRGVPDDYGPGRTLRSTPRE